jgi:hypothetical protein
MNDLGYLDRVTNDDIDYLDKAKTGTTLLVYFLESESKYEPPPVLP